MNTIAQSVTKLKDAVARFLAHASERIAHASQPSLASEFSRAARSEEDLT